MRGYCSLDNAGFGKKFFPSDRGTNNVRQNIYNPTERTVPTSVAMILLLVEKKVAIDRGDYFAAIQGLVTFSFTEVPVLHILAREIIKSGQSCTKDVVVDIAHEISSLKAVTKRAVARSKKQI